MQACYIGERCTGAWLENLTKPLSSLLNPVAERLGNWLGKRKPKLYVHFNPVTRAIGLSMNGSQEMTNVNFVADFTHDDNKQKLLIVDAYPEGSISQIGFIDKFSIPPGTLVTQRVSAFVSPIGEKGKPWTGRIILVDQFKRKYKTEKVSFRWIGPTDFTCATRTGTIRISRGYRGSQDYATAVTQVARLSPVRLGAFRSPPRAYR